MALDEEHKDRVERMKILYDLNKHITTLSTGTLLLMAGWLDKVFKTPVWKPLAAGAFLLFAACIIFLFVQCLDFLCIHVLHSTPKRIQ
jgi:hypothetical protein